MVWTPRQSRMLGTSDGVPATSSVIARPSKALSVQPQSPVGIDWGNPITRGLSFGFVAGQIVNLAKGSLLTIDNTGVTSGVNRGGKSVSFAGGSTNSGRIRGTVQDAAQNTFVVIVGNTNPAAGGTGSNGRVISTFNGTGGHDIFLGGFGVGMTYAVYATTTSGQYSPTDTVSGSGWTELRCYGYSWDGVIGNAPIIYRDGYQSAVTTVASAAGTRIAGGTNCDVGARPDVSTRQGSFTTTLALKFDRALSANELASITANPWQIFKPNSSPIWGPV